MNNIETLKWFEEFYNRNKKLVDIIIKNDKKKMYIHSILDLYSLINGEEKYIKVYQIKGYTKFNFDELRKVGETLEIYTCNGKPTLLKVYSNYFPGVRKVNNKQYLDENSLKRLRDVFRNLMINLEYFKAYRNENN